MKIFLTKCLLISFFAVSNCLAVSSSIKSKKTKIIGNIIKTNLETYHYRHYKIDDSISSKAFDQYIKKIDYGKQFLLKKDIKKLEIYRKLIDDELISGKLNLLDDSVKVLRKRIKQVDSFRAEIFKKKFDFSKKESLELDPDKKKFAKTERELKEHWRKLLKHSALIRYISLLEDQEDEIENIKKEKSGKKPKGKKAVTKKNKNAKKKKFVKKTPKQLQDKAEKAISKKYKQIFARLLKDDLDDHLEKYFNAVSSIFDPHTVYFPPKKKEDFDIDISGSLEGIGAVLQEDGQYIKVVKIVPGGAAWRGKDLEVDDLLIAVSQGDGEAVDLVDMRVDDAVRYIRGKKGTEVRLTVKKVNGTRKVVKIIRDVVEMGASFAKSSVIENKELKEKIGYIYLPKFYREFKNNNRNCTDDVRKEIRRLNKLGINGLILDLRNNGGGALEDSRQMSGLFIKKGPIVQVRDYANKIEVLEDDNESVEFNGNVIVLINRYSASASEILAGALQDYKRAIIVGGEFSHGKGTVQAVLDLNQGPFLSLFGPTMGALKITVQKFYRISGISTQYKGVTPDIVVPDPFSYTKNREKDLDFSLPWDKVNSLKYNKWTKHKYDMPLLVKRSKARVDNSIGYSKMKKSIDYLKKNREKTKISLNYATVKKEDEARKVMAEKLKMDTLNKNIIVTNFEESLKEAQKISKADKKKWDEDFKKKKTDWIESIQKDVELVEALYIMDDMINMSKSKKLR